MDVLESALALSPVFLFGLRNFRAARLGLRLTTPTALNTALSTFKTVVVNASSISRMARLAHHHLEDRLLQGKVLFKPRSFCLIPRISMSKERLPTKDCQKRGVFLALAFQYL